MTVKEKQSPSQSFVTNILSLGLNNPPHPDLNTALLYQELGFSVRAALQTGAPATFEYFYKLFFKRENYICGGSFFIFCNTAL